MKKENISTIFFIIILTVIVVFLIILYFKDYRNKQIKINNIELKNCIMDSDCLGGLSCSKETLCEKNNPNSCIETSYCKDKVKRITCGDSICEGNETVLSCSIDCDRDRFYSDCNELTNQISKELGILQTCSANSDCIKKDIRLPCAMSICGVVINKNKDKTSIEALTDRYLKKGCEQGCPGAACPNPDSMTPECIKNKCIMKYSEKVNTV